ncbi:MAG: nitrous oxide reductase family maturation protein NosD [Saprospiraceae bacterium]|nr:nitrous oxide reductase family maturation protein NosD [Saprospiraceae bacterium]
MKNDFLILLGLLLFFNCSNANTLISNKTHSIKEAVRQAQCGDTITIDPGIYSEGNIVIDKSLTIIGIGDCILDGEGKFEIFTIQADDISLINLKFQKSGYSATNDFASVKILSSKYFHIHHCEILDSYFGIHISNCSYGSISECKIIGSPDKEQNTGNSIHIWKSDHIQVFKNFCKGHRDGIYFEFVTDSYIYENISSHNIRYGLHFMFSHSNTYFHNKFIENGAGVAVMYSKNVVMHYNLFKENWGPSSFGILLKDITDSKMYGNQFIKNSAGIYMEGSNRCIIENNLFKENGWALRVQANCNDNEIKKNNFINNTFDVSCNGSLVLNKFDNNYWDRYVGYDLNKDGVGDLAYHPVSLYSVLVEQNPAFLILLRSVLINILDQVERIIPILTPIDLKDNSPSLKYYKFND